MKVNKLTEGLNPNDLDGRIEDTIHFDEYKPKMGDDDAIIVASFKVFGKQPAFNLENFIEKGYSWILDVDVSAGEISEGNYLVFVEAERRTYYAQNFMNLISDINNITDVKDWKMVYYERQDTKKNLTYPLTLANMASVIPNSPKKYRDSKTAITAIESILNTARVPRKAGDINEFKSFIPKNRI